MEILAPDAVNEQDQGDPGVRPRVVVAVVLLAVPDGEVSLLLRHVGGQWGFPRGVLGARESLDAAAGRVLADLTASTGSTRAACHLEQLSARGEAGGDPDERELEVTYLALGLPTAATPGSSGGRWWPVRDVPTLGSLHREVLDAALERLRRHLAHTGIAWSLLPEEFSLSELQTVYEAVEGRRLDKRNFRKWVLACSLVEATPHQRRDGAHRPARLYRFTAGGNSTARSVSAER